jgi:hypothetical protein
MAGIQSSKLSSKTSVIPDMYQAALNPLIAASLQ